jgi:hypothetical protein
MPWWTSVFVLLLAGVACSSDDPTLERRGGPPPTPTADPIAMMPATGGMSGGETSDGTSGGETSGGGAGEGGEPAAGGSGPAEIPATTFCEALAVVRAKCQRCHTRPPKNGAPVPFLTYDDFQAPYGSSGSTYAEVATRAVELDVMPYVVLNEPPTSLMPPVQALTSEEKATLLSWLKQGAMPEGGTECP